MYRRTHGRGVLRRRSWRAAFGGVFVKQFVRTFVVGSALLAMVAVAAPASAQDASQVDLGIGYQWLHAPDQSYPLGFNVDLSGALTGDLRWVGEFGWSRDSEGDFGLDASLTATSFGAGLRWAPASASYHPYAQVILGGQRDSINVDGDVTGDLFDESETTFILQPGAGVTVPVGPKWGVFGQADWRRIFYEGNGTNDFRFVVGARINLK
jgi:hypothetical protein